ncbi:nitrile hydratase subunit alpha [Beijerinckia mobilis]|uniref:nitrile hydratase subunit alpha n=1 Tax=Beijerinckia mobilis TaxID=231434 RepID=UPI000A94CE87|nr:nitrile hydratase subunit alpha [Beijerinckia mobilis]
MTIPRDTKRVIALQEELHSHLPSDPALRVKALESLLVEKGLLSSATVDRWIEVFRDEVGPKNGARIVARAWTNPIFKQRLMINAIEAIAGMGFPRLEANNLVVVENTPRRHNIVVCTLCSCYPWAVLGIPPTWYKSFEYRARVVRDPRGVLKEFGLELDDDVEVRVWDSTAETRYMVLPERPPRTEGFSEEELAAIVSRDAMVGVAKVITPERRS